MAQSRIAWIGVTLLLGVVGGIWKLDAALNRPDWAGSDDGKALLLEFRQEEMRRHARAGVESGHRLRPADAPLPPHYPPADPFPPYDVQHYTIDLEIFPADTVATGSTTMVGEVLQSDLDSLRVDYCGPEVSGVELDGAPTDAWVRHHDKLAVALDPPLKEGDAFTLKVFHGGRHEAGIYFDHLGVHTYSEPEDARWWFPCRDVPNDKATLDMIVTAPAEMTAAGNGLLIDVTSLAAGRRRFHWRELHPLAPYLMTFQAADYPVSRDDRVPGVPIWNYVHPADSAAAATNLERVPEMLQYFTARFGPYPFDKYGHSSANFGGGMEHQSLSMIGRFFLTYYESIDGLLAHELVHQWFGDAVTLADWRHIWLNEAFASYGEALWFEHRQGRAGLLSRMDLFADLFRRGYLLQGQEIPVYDPPANRLFSFAVYDKGAWIVHMLRGIVGDTAFFNILRTYQERHRYGNANTDDFISICEEIHGSDLDWYFTPWLNEPGLPRFIVGTRAKPIGDGRYDLEVSVSQDEVDAFFPMPITVALRYQAGEKRRSFDMNSRTLTFRDTLGAAPVDTVALLDPDGWILKTVKYEAIVPVRVTGLVAATQADGFVTLRWRHEDGPRDAQFRVWRGNIPGILTRTPTANAVNLTPEWVTGTEEYEFVDATPGPDAAWWIEARDREGAIDWYGPVRATGTAPPARLDLVAVPGADGPHLAVTLPRAGHLHIDLFDPTGRRVRTLVDRTLDAGRHDITWDGHNESGNAVNGVFFARARFEGETATARVIRAR